MNDVIKLLPHCMLAALLTAPSLPASGETQTAQLIVHADRTGPQISPLLYGIFFEEINCAGDGGLYAEMVRNRSFEEAADLQHWSVEGVGAGNDARVVEINRSEFNRHALELTTSGTAPLRLVQHGYWGIPLNKGAAYEFSLDCRAEAPARIHVSLESASGQVYSAKTFAVGSAWDTVRLRLKARETDPAARLVLSPSGEAKVWVDMISLFPRDTWKQRANGLRPDLAEMLEGLEPAFVRFPGGCWVEGDTMKLAYRWKQTIGPLRERRTQYNIWQYHSTHGLGYHEYLQMCEDLGAETLFVINCGMSHREVVPMAELGPYIQDALDAIEYANGPVNSQWGALRAANGHPKPFRLAFMQIGNENGGPAYEERYAAFYRAIKAKYPEMRIIANEWQGRPKNAPLEIVDEHYYSHPGFFIQNANKYDAYPRTGPKIYVGEYAVTQNSGQGNLRGALGEAAFMTGMERNSDVVIMASYAPLFANVNYKKWNPDLINFDSSRVYGTPSYYVQKLFRDNLGKEVVPLEVQAAEWELEIPKGGIGLGTWQTQAEYRGIRVTAGDNLLYAWEPGQGLSGWRSRGGQWQGSEGALQQTGGGEDRRLLAGDPNWRDYTLTLQARKLGGAEGFLILFRVQNDNNWFWWNIGGWGNTQHAIEKTVDGGKSMLGQAVSGRVETGRWYDVKVEVAGTRIRCYLDNQLVHELEDNTRLRPLHAVANWQPGELILKVVNVSPADLATDLRFDGLRQIGSRASLTVLTSENPTDENSLNEPRKVAPETKTLHNVAPEFRHTFPAHSLSVLRIPAKR